MIYFFAGFVLGEVFAWVNLITVMIICVIAVMVMYLIIKNTGQSRLWLVLPLFFYYGAAVTVLASSDSEFEELWKNRSFAEEYASAKGTIEKIDTYDNSVRITLRNVSVCISDKWYDSGNIFIYADKNHKDLIPGSSVIAYGNISRLKKASNPGQFDAENYYKALNIEYSMAASGCDVTEYNENSLSSILYRLKQFLQSRLKFIVEDEDYEVLSAMLLGDKNQLGEELKSLYQLNGIAHILTISGLHISMLGSGLYKLFRRLGGGFILSSSAAGIIICLYGLMTGLGTSSLRAIIMFIIMLTADCLGKSYDMTSAVCLAGILVLTEYPLMLYQFAFQMSVICILAIALAVPNLCSFLHIESRFLRTVVNGCAVQWCTMPILLYHMYTYPVFSVLINMAVIPLVEMVMISGILGIVISLINYDIAVFMAGAAHYILMFYKKICEFVSGFENALFIPGRPDLWKIFIYYFVLLISMGYMSYKVSKDKKMPNNTQNISVSEDIKLDTVQSKGNWEIGKLECLDNNKGLSKRDICSRYISVMSFIMIGVFILAFCGHRQLRITFADVGQGDCILVELESGTTALIDCGSSNITDVGNSRIIPMLNFYGIESLDYVFLSHADSDHINGISALIEDKKVKNIILPFRLDNSGFIEITTLAGEYGIPVLYINTGDKISVGETSFICLGPSGNDSVSDENSSSMVLKLEYKEFSVLFTGDLDMTGESRVLEAAKAYNINLDSDILKVGHHGSKYSTSDEFLSYVKPENSIISCSESNTYGHPSKEAIERLNQSMSDIYITKDSGAVIISTDGCEYRIKEFCKNVYKRIGGLLARRNI